MFNSRRILSFLLMILASPISLFAQQPSPYPWTNEKLDSLLDEIRNSNELDAKTKSLLADSAFQIAVQLKQPCAQIDSRLLQAVSLDGLGLADSALHQLLWTNSQKFPECPDELKWRLYSGLTNVFISLGEYGRVDSIATIVRQSYRPSGQDIEPYLSIMTNAGIAKAYTGQLDEATILFHSLLSESRKAANSKFIQKSLINLSTIKGITEDYDSAYYFLEVAAENLLATNDTDAYMALLLNLSVMDMGNGRFGMAEARLDSAEKMAIRLNNLRIRVNVLSNRAYLAENKKEFPKAYGYLREYITLQDSLLNQERIKAVTEMQEKYESEKKAKEIEQLKVENLDATLKAERVRHARNRFIYAGLGILLVAIGLYSRLQYTNRAKAAIQREKDVSEGLLLNILPSSVAEELKTKGYADAKLVDLATILFSDFKNFTETASTMQPAELVAELNACFRAFDEIITKHGLEKIKTIGDAYMAASAVPETNASTVTHVILAAMDMQEFVISRKKEHEVAGRSSFEMRIGIHSGPVVAGIVGVKKFQYDIWGDTVNIASRMETNGEPGKINISEATYQLIKDDPQFSFTLRGMISVKGKGEMEMYFVEKAEA